MVETGGIANGAANGEHASVGTPSRVTLPIPDRTEPHRSWINLYAPGKAHDAPFAVPPPPSPVAEPAAAPPPPIDPAARVVSAGYRLVEENLRRGRLAASELRGAGQEFAEAARRLEPQHALGAFSRAFFDPALTGPVVELARTWLGVLGQTIQPPSAGTAGPSPTPVTPTPLHPQQRPEYEAPAPAAIRLLKLLATGPGEWLADMEVEGRVRRVQIRAVDGELL